MYVSYAKQYYYSSEDPMSNVELMKDDKDFKKVLDVTKSILGVKFTFSITTQKNW